MSKILPASISIKPKDKEDLNLQLSIANHVLLQVLLNERADQISKERKIPVLKVKAEIDGKLAEARVTLLSEIDALYGE